MHAPIRAFSPLPRLAVLGLVALSALLPGGGAQAQYPDKTIKIIVGFPAGGPPDLTARLLAEKFQASLDKPVIVENVLGAGGNIASARFSKAEPDGYTLYLAGNGSMVINPSLYEKLPYDPQKDMAPISQVVSWPNILAVSNELPVKTVQDLASLARAKPDELTYGHSGVGISTHLAAEQFKQMASLAIRPVGYTGGNNAMPDVIAGRVSMCFCAFANVMELARDGKVRALAVTSLERSPTAPELPTMAEAGFPGYHATAWFALMAPAGTPQPIIDRLNTEAVKAVKAPDVVAKLNAQGIVTIGGTPAELTAVMKAETAYWAKLINAIDLKLK
jgi:tripartite-type tricarboxylate transporter receptor subunit TctC